jgi:hypothetical protein
VITEQQGVDKRRRGRFWGINGLVSKWTSLVGLDGITLLLIAYSWHKRLARDPPHPPTAIPLAEIDRQSTSPIPAARRLG